MKIKNFVSEFRLYLCNHFINKVPSHTIRLWYYRKVMKFNIGQGSYIFLGCTFDGAKGLVIGKHTVINANCRLDTRGGLYIGNNVSVSSDVVFITADHDMDSPNMKGRQSAVRIEDYVWIGTRVTVLPGITINKGAVAAACSLVAKDVAEKCVVGGIPAKFIRERKGGYEYTASYKRLLQ